MNLQLQLVNLPITSGAVIKYVLKQTGVPRDCSSTGTRSSSGARTLQRAVPSRPNLTRCTFRRVKPELSNGGNTFEPLFRAFSPRLCRAKKKTKTASAENGDSGTREQTEQAGVPPVIQIYPMFGLRNKYSAQNTL